MWNFKYKNQYLNYVSDPMQDTAVQSMRLLPQHRAGVSCYHHSVLVSYASWRVCDWLGLDARAAARGGLLHDFYLYNWRDAASHPGIRHGSQHPEVALRNARARFSLTWREEDIILSHMFPLYPHQGVPLPGIGGGEYHGQAVCRRRAGRAGAPAHPLPPGDPLLAGRRLGSYPAAQGRLIPRRMSSEMTDFHSIPAAAAAGTLRGFPSGKVFDRLSAAQWAALFPLYGKCT